MPRDAAYKTEHATPPTLIAGNTLVGKCGVWTCVVLWGSGVALGLPRQVPPPGPDAHSCLEDAGDGHGVAKD